MNNLDDLDASLAQARELALKLLDGEQFSLTNKNNISKSGGVYLFLEGRANGEPARIYVGIARNLRRRIHTDHLSAELKDTMSALRKSLNKLRNLDFGPAMREWFRLNCKVAYVEIDDSDMRRIVEAILVKHLRSPELLNKN
jgi:hypothetical protein